MILRRSVFTLCLSGALALISMDLSRIDSNESKSHDGVQSSQKVDYETAGIEAMREFNIAHVRYALNYLASDSLEGRETSEPGQEKAAAFIAQRFKELGLKPLGDNGTYFQHFFVNVHYISDSSFVEADGKYFRTNRDIVVLPFGAGDTTVTAPVVFVGYGFEDDTYSDYKGINVNGKIVVILAGNPPFADTGNIIIRTELHKRSNALKHGAALVLLAVTGGDAAFAKIHQRFGSMIGNKMMAIETGKKTKGSPTMMQMIYIREEVANELLKARETNLEDVAQLIDSTKNPVAMGIRHRDRQSEIGYRNSPN